jgi:hypothetical protein
MTEGLSKPASKRTRCNARMMLLCGAAAFGLSAACFGVACGGSSGHEGLPMAGPLGDATVGDGPETSLTPLDATSDRDAGPPQEAGSGDFDVQIMYADRVLPDVDAPPEAGSGEAGGPTYPNCPQFIPVALITPPDAGPDAGPQLVQVPPNQATDEIPSTFDDAGNIVPAPPDSACATYGWLGSTAIDECYTSRTSLPFNVLPPCNWCQDAGNAVQGPGAGRSMYQLCMDLYTCMIATGCTQRVPRLSDGGLGPEQGPNACLCGANPNPPVCAMNPAGPCMMEEMAALQEPLDKIVEALGNMTNLATCAGKLNEVFLDAISSSTVRGMSCFPPLAWDAGAD